MRPSKQHAPLGGHPSLTRQQKQTSGGNSPGLRSNSKGPVNSGQYEHRQDFQNGIMNDFDNIYDDQLLHDIGNSTGTGTTLRRQQPDVVQTNFASTSSPTNKLVSVSSPGMRSSHSPTIKKHDKPADVAGWSMKKERGMPAHVSETTEETYAVHFRVRYETSFGEEVFVVGNLPDLGDWKDHKHMLKWTEGHIWVSVKPLITKQRHFRYKYRVLCDSEVRHWEDGIDRICHPELLPEGRSSLATTADGPGSGIAYNSGYRNVLADDKWQTYDIALSVFDPLYAQGDEMWIEPSADSGFEAVKMTRVSAVTLQDTWLSGKYGKPVPLWRGKFEIQNAQNTPDGQFPKGKNIVIDYSFVKASMSQMKVLERQPRRRLVIQNPHDYRSHLSPDAPQFNMQERIWTVNGVAEKAEGTFLQGFFFHEIGEDNTTFNIILGSYPLYEVDVDRMQMDGRITAVLSLQSNEEIAQRGVDEQEMRGWLSKHRIQYLRRPVDDLASTEDYADALFDAAVQLDRLLEKRHRVYVHCTAGQSRSTTLAITYLCLFIKSKHWQSPGLVEQNLLKMHKGATPNMRAVSVCLHRRAQFQRDILDRMQRETDAEALARKQREAERRRLDKILRQEEQNLWQRREEYLRIERENERRRRLSLEEEQRQRLLMEQKKRQREEQERQRLIALDGERIAELEETLRQLTEEEQEQIRLLKLRLEETHTFEHFFVGDADLASLNERDLAQLCEQLYSTSPIPFVPRKGNALESELRAILQELRVAVPVIHIKDTLYLVGDSRIHIERKRETVMANIGGGYQEFVAWLQKELPRLERALLVKMIQSRESLETICQWLCEGKQIRPATAAMIDGGRRNSEGMGRYFAIERRAVADLSSTKTKSPSPIRSSRRSTGMTSPTSFDKSLRSSPSPTSRKSRIAGATPKSPTSGRFSLKSPASTRSAEASIASLREKYEAKRREVQRELDYTLMERTEHVNQGDQTVPECNTGRYRYVHNKQQHH